MSNLCVVICYIISTVTDIHTQVYEYFTFVFTDHDRVLAVDELATIG